MFPQHRSLSSPIAIVALLFGCVVLGLPASLDAVSIRWSAASGPTNQMVEVLGLPREALRTLQKVRWSSEQWQKLLAVYADQGDITTDLWLPPMAGEYEAASESLRFRPRFPLEPAVSYRAIFDPSKLPSAPPGKSISSTFRFPRPPSESQTRVTAIYPTTARLPENLLKFYLFFSSAMSRGNIYDHIHLLDESGKAVELPFLEINEELWDLSMTRLTLFLDPGRIKRGVKPLEEVGPALQENRSYTLVIDSAWLDAQGNRLKDSFRKQIKVTPPDREPIDPDTWKVYPPGSGTATELRVDFGKPLDYALARRMIRVVNPANRQVTGEVRLSDEERRWHFAPRQNWTAGQYYLEVQTALEDLAGNNVGKPFEVDLFDGVQRHLSNSVVRVPFQLR